MSDYLDNLIDRSFGVNPPGGLTLQPRREYAFEGATSAENWSDLQTRSPETGTMDALTESNGGRSTFPMRPSLRERETSTTQVNVLPDRSPAPPDRISWRDGSVTSESRSIPADGPIQTRWLTPTLGNPPILNTASTPEPIPSRDSQSDTGQRRGDTPEVVPSPLPRMVIHSGDRPGLSDGGRRQHSVEPSPEIIPKMERPVNPVKVLFDTPREPIERRAQSESINHQNVSSIQMQIRPLTADPLPIAPPPEKATETVINVTIGRVEIRATPSAPAVRSAPQRQAAPAMNLDEYLRKRQGGV
jgi:hypothetical protein